MEEKKSQLSTANQSLKKNDGQGKEIASSGIMAYLHDFVWLLAVVLFVFMLIFRVVIVSGPSMQATLLDGDYLFLVGNLFYNNPQRGDIIVASKESFRDGEPIVKRVIATEGQKVDIDFTLGVVYVDDVPLDEPYTLTPTNMQEGLSFPVTVDDNCVFVMGDNRNDSKDSRSTEIGQIDCREILGKAVFLIFPGNNKGSVPRDFSRIGVLQ